MIEFVYGSHGSGKTEYIFDLISADAANGVRSFLVVPEQAAVSTEREALGRLPASAQLTFEVLNFSRMCNRVFRECGGLSYRQLTPGMRRILMMRALKQTAPLMEVYGNTAMTDKSFPAIMQKTVAELKNCGITPEEMKRLTDRANPRLAPKLRDITMCSAVYDTLAGEAGDPASDAEKLAETLERNNFFAGSHVYIDAFSGLTGIQHRIIKAIFSGAEKTVVTLPLPSPAYRGTDTLSLRRMSDRLRRDAALSGKETSTVCMTELRRYKGKDLACISGKLWENASAPSERDGSVTIITAENSFDEAEFAAGLAKKLLEDGARCRDILLVARDPSAYKGIIDPAFEDAGVPFWISEKQQLSLTSPSRLILSALRIITSGWRREDVTSHLRTGLYGVTASDADVFIAYAEKWRIGGKGFTSGDFSMNPSGYVAEMKDTDIQKLNTANKVRRSLCDSIGALAEDVDVASDCRGICRAVYRYLEKLDVKDRLLAAATLALKEGRRAEATELAKTFKAFVTALSELSDAYAGAVKPSTPEFSEALAAILECSEIGSIPASADCVTLASADMLRASSPEYVILLGVKDGSFPASPAASGLLSEEDRSYLSGDAGLVLSDRSSSSSDELYYFRRAIAQAGKGVFIFTRKDCTSVPVSRIKRILPGVAEIKTASMPELLLSSEKVAAGWLPLISGTAVGTAAAELLGKDKEALLPPEIDSANASINGETAVAALGNDMLLSQSQLNKYLDCPFAYACSKLLGLDDNRTAAFSYDTIGNYTHSILENYLKEIYIVRGGVYPDKNDNKALLKAIAKSALDKIAPEGSPQRTGLISHMADRLEILAEVVTTDIANELTGSDLVPEHFELEIGPGKFPPVSLPLKDGGKVSFIGKVDRIDVCRKDGNAFIRVVDYKTGSKNFSIKDIDKGENLQLLLYLLSLTGSGQKDFFGGSPEPASFEYLSTNATRLDEIQGSDSESIEKSALGLSRAGIILEGCEDIVNRANENRYLMKTSKTKSTVSPDVYDELKEKVTGIIISAAEGMRSGNAAAKPRGGKDTCKNCRFSGVCRSSVKTEGERES